MWLCIHNKEAPWNDKGDPYYGGLQMGLWFMKTYANKLYKTKGTADKWTATEQLNVAENAWKREGFSMSWLRSQWPKTSYGCI